MTRYFVLFLLILGQINTYHQYREVICKTKNLRNRGGPEKAKCLINLKNEELDKGRDGPIGIGCFTEQSAKEEPKEFCDLVCPKAHTVFVAHIDVGHRACFNYYNYELIQRKDEWFLMRSGECANSTITFRIGCKFDNPFNETFRSDNEVFAHLRSRKSTVLKKKN